LPSSPRNMRFSALPIVKEHLKSEPTRGGSLGSRSTSPWDILDLKLAGVFDPYVFFNHGHGTTLHIDNEVFTGTKPFSDKNLYPGGLTDRGFVPLSLPILTLRTACSVLLLLSYPFDTGWMGGFRFAGVLIQRTSVGNRRS
jgi:hypothetical protein